MSDLPPEDRPPDFAPGPKGPEDTTPGRLFRLNGGQLRKMAEFAAGFDGVLELEERGAGYYELRLLDAEGEASATHRIFPFY